MMPSTEIRFQDGSSYESMMGTWSRIVGARFLDWLGPAPGQRWLDVGCGTGAFTQLIVERCAPAGVTGIDPAESQLAFARQRGLGAVASFRPGDALALPFADSEFDSAVSALVIFFMPDPARGVAEMARTVRPGGTISTYAWDLTGGGFPYDPVQAEMQAIGLSALGPPHPEAGELDALRRLWAGAGLDHIETLAIEIERAFDDFEHYWALAMTVPGIGPVVANLPPETLAQLRQRVAARVGTTADGRVVQPARAHAIRGIRPG